MLAFVAFVSDSLYGQFCKKTPVRQPYLLNSMVKLSSILRSYLSFACCSVVHDVRAEEEVIRLFILCFKVVSIEELRARLCVSCKEALWKGIRHDELKIEELK